MTTRNPFSLKGKVAVVTGGLGQLGSAFVETLEASGARVFAADLPGAEPFRRGGRRRPYVPIDVTDDRSVQEAATFVHRTAGRVDIWINNAGIGVFTSYEDRTVSEFEKVLDINVKGVFLCTRAASHVMAPSRGGVILNIASIYGLVSPDPRIYADSGRNSSEVYGASKSAVVSMTRYFAVHLGPKNIRVNAITPGGIFNHQSPLFVKEYCARTPLNRMARESDISCAAVFLASSAASYMTGHNLVVDGGWTAW